MPVSKPDKTVSGTAPDYNGKTTVACDTSPRVVELCPKPTEFQVAGCQDTTITR